MSKLHMLSRYDKRGKFSIGDREFEIFSDKEYTDSLIIISSGEVIAPEKIFNWAREDEKIFPIVIGNGLVFNIITQTSATLKKIY